MQINLLTLIEILTYILAAIVWNEYGYYYFKFYRQTGFEWPGRVDDDNQNLTKILIIADTHIMGPIKSVWIDKFWREWEMKQAFRITNQIFEPDLVVFLGDIIDESSFSQDQAFYQAKLDFERIFPINQLANQRTIILAGNHDVGFHNHMTKFPYVLFRFAANFNATTNVELIRVNDLNIIASNSMAFYDDSCEFCTDSIAATNRLTNYLENERAKSPNDFSKPILLTHIPLYREYDTDCDFPQTMNQILKRPNVEGKDVLHSRASNFLLENLKPRLILSGHTHLKCKTKHGPADELTVNSYNHKYSEKTPGFLLLAANSTHLYTSDCELIDEKMVVAIYAATLLLILARVYVSTFINRPN